MYRLARSSAISVKEMNRSRKRKKRPAAKTKESEKENLPVARKIAQSANLDIHTLVGTGPDGRITKADVLRALPDEKKTNKMNQSISQST